MLDRRVQLLRVLNQVGTITEAAELLQRSVSGYSRQLRSLADELGVELLEHHGRQVRLTPAANRVIAYADETHAAWEQVAAALAHSTEEVTGTLRLGGHPTALSALVIPNLGALSGRYPQLRVQLSETEVPRCFDQLVTGDLDACLIAAQNGVPPASDRRFQQHRLVTEPIDALVASTHPLAELETVQLAALAEEPWVLPDADQSGHHEVLSACHAAGFVPGAVHYGQDTQTVADLVETTASVTLTSRFATYHGPARRIPLAGHPAPARHLLLCTRKGTDTSPLVQALRELITDRPNI